MPNKKGSKVAASNARAQAMAKKKARHGGPVLAAAAYVPPPPPAEGDAADTGGVVAQAAPASATGSVAVAAGGAAVAARPTQAAPAGALRGSGRERAHQTPPALSVSLRREVGTIGVLTAVVIVVIVALQLFTDLGG